MTTHIILLKPVSLVQDGRLLIREGNLTQITREGTETEMYVFLFSDIIMASRPTNVRKNIIDRTLRFELYGENEF